MLNSRTLGQTFSDLLTRIGGFEPAPHIAVAVSGGSDSMALCLLADDWARRRSGRVTGLIVDHGLRAESEQEARRVADWLARREVSTTLLRWRGKKPTKNVQAEARRARYALLTGWCRAAGVLHLLLAHHREDQGETFLLRLGRGSGSSGLAAMAEVMETADVRILRPLLGISKIDLRQFLGERDQPWIEDPTNRCFARGKLRTSLAAIENGDVTLKRAAQAASAIGATRSVVDSLVADFLSRSMTIHGAGFCLLDTDAWRRSEDEIRARALIRVLGCVGGGDYPPRRSRLERLLTLISSQTRFPGRTLAGCRLVPLGPAILVCREIRAIQESVSLLPGQSTLWDRRFVIHLRRWPTAGSPKVRHLGLDGWRQIVAIRPDLRATAIPFPARGALPALWDLDGVAVTPHLGFLRPDLLAEGSAATAAVFRPARSLAPAPFAPPRPVMGPEELDTQIKATPNVND